MAMKVDFVVKDAWVFMTYRQCFEKRDVAVAGEKIYAVSPAICYPDVTMVDGSGMYMIPGLVDIHNLPGRIFPHHPALRRYNRCG